MKTIHKYKLEIRLNKLELSKYAKILHVNIQRNDICLWALVDTEDRVETRHIEVVGTGWEISNNSIYIGTVLCHDGALVWHVIERM